MHDIIAWSIIIYKKYNIIAICFSILQYYKYIINEKPICWTPFLFHATVIIFVVLIAWPLRGTTLLFINTGNIHWGRTCCKKNYFRRHQDSPLELTTYYCPLVYQAPYDQKAKHLIISYLIILNSNNSGLQNHLEDSKATGSNG